MSQLMQGKTVLITGGTGGIGLQTAIGLATQGALVIVTGRDQKRGEAGVADIVNASGSDTVELLLADLSVQADVRELADRFTRRYDRLDMLINNAGLLEGSRRTTVDGIEADFAVNVVAPFLLTQALLPVLQQSTPARVINVTGGMVRGTIDLANLQAEQGFEGLRTYTHAKLAMMAMSLEFARRLAGTGISVNIAYPGYASTEMTKAMTPTMLPTAMRFMYPVFRLWQRADGGKSARKAAQSSIYLASHSTVASVSGAYYDTNSKRSKPPATVTDPHVQQYIWAEMERLTGRDIRPHATLNTTSQAAIGGVV